MSTNAPPPVQAPAKTSGLAVASLILGIAGPCTVGIGSVLGVILGIVGLVKIGKSAGQLAGRGLAIAGLIVSGVGFVMLLFIVPFAAAILLPAFTGTRNAAYATSSLNNVKQLCAAAHMYAAENKDQFPPGDSWPEALKAIGFTDQALADPAEHNGGRAYAINALVAGKDQGAIERRSETVLFFECAPGSPTAGGPEILPPAPRHGRAYVIGFCDGHVELVAKSKLGRLIWNPAEGKPNEQE